MSVRELTKGSLIIAIGLLFCVNGCARDPQTAEGEFGRPIELGTGDDITAPRLARLPGECPGSAGGCPTSCIGPPGSCPDDACMPVLIDTFTPITTIVDPGRQITDVERTCIEVRAAAGLMTETPSEVASDRAVTRFRFEDVATALAPAEPSEGLTWDWRVGDHERSSYVSGVIGGNLLRHYGVRFHHRRIPGQEALREYSVTFYSSFLGTDEVLADNGWSFIPVQFPGRLLGKNVNDVCQFDGESCDFRGPFEIDNNRVQSALQPTRMVLDACLTPPPAGVFWDPLTTNRDCKLAPGIDYDEAAYLSPIGRTLTGDFEEGCTPLDEVGVDRPAAGVTASLVVATGVTDLVLFADSVERMFGSIDALPLCDELPVEVDPLEVARGAPACLEPGAGELYLPGWPPAGVAGTTPVLQLRIRSLALVPGLLHTAGPPACSRLETRLHALRAQCEQSTRLSAPSPGPLLSGDCVDAAADPIAWLGEVALAEGQLAPDPTRWIRTLVLDPDHPIASTVRRDTSPEARQPDGLLGTVLFDDTDVALDYRDSNPGLALRCLDPDRGQCLSMPACQADEDDPDAETPEPRCCHGLPRPLLIDLIQRAGIYDCCAALAEHVREELNRQAVEDGFAEPCPSSNLAF
ncbi:MAG: hypothetical protein KC636_11460 [Myxococcales bacterium]|nr:hypothetical protein [Myxococcales bacterium]